MTSRSNPSTHSTRQTSTRSSSNATAPAQPSQHPIVNRSNGSPSWPTRYWPSPLSTGCSPPHTSSSSTASPTDDAKNPDSTPTTSHQPRVVAVALDQSLNS